MRHRPLSRADYERLLAEGHLSGERLELLGGVMVTKGGEAIFAVTRLSTRLRAFDGRTWLLARLPLAVTDAPEPEPDLAVIPLEADPGRIPDATLWVIEVVHGVLKVDPGLKAAIYAEAEVPEYWLFDLQGGVLEVMTVPVEGRYRQQRCYRPPHVVSPQAFPEVQVPLDEMLGPRSAQ